MICGIKDKVPSIDSIDERQDQVLNPSQSSEKLASKETRKRDKIGFLLKTVAHELRSNYGFVVAILSGLQAKTTTIALQSFGTILYTDSFTAQGLSIQDAKHHLSLLFLISNFLSVITGLLFGYLSDKIKIHKLIQIVNLLVMASLSILIQ